MCGPKFCSMNWSSKVDAFNKEVHGLEKKDLTQLVNLQAETLARPGVSALHRAEKLHFYQGTTLQPAKNSVCSGGSPLLQQGGSWISVQRKTNFKEWALAWISTRPPVNLSLPVVRSRYR